MKQLILSLSAATVLAGCAGGSGVAIPDTVSALPNLKPVEADRITPATGGDAATSLHTGGGRLENVHLRYVHPTLRWDMDDDKLIYEAPDGKRYSFTDGFTDPLVPSPSFAQNPNAPTKHAPQPTGSGGKLIACCEQNSGTTPAAYVNSMRYGVWFGADGTVDLFAGGIPAPVADMQHAAGHTSPTGKATYEVWAFRAKDGLATSSSWNVRDPNIRSLLTVNFNTGKVGGTIKGNADFGPDIAFGDVNVSGNTFGGSVTSGGTAGRVDGGFYGKSGWYDPAGSEIGGKITFGGNSSLNSSFGGSMVGSDKDDLTSTDLNPVP